MHVGLLLEHSDPGRGGAERYAAALAERLRGRGHRVTAVSRTGPAARAVPRWLPRSERPGFYARAFVPWLHAQGAERILTLQPVPGCDFYQPPMGIQAAATPPRRETLPAAGRLLRRLDLVRALHHARLRRWEARAVAAPTRVLALSPRVVDDLRRFHPGAPIPLLLRAGAAGAAPAPRSAARPAAARRRPRLRPPGASYRGRGAAAPAGGRARGRRDRRRPRAGAGAPSGGRRPGALARTGRRPG
ncbi:MAG: hypothetical protein ACE5JG_13615, partial [Planctomycetota bacterium]